MRRAFFIATERTKMKKTKVNKLINDIEGTLNSLTVVDIEYNFPDAKDEMMEKLKELRAELGIWDK